MEFLFFESQIFLTILRTQTGDDAALIKSFTINLIPKERTPITLA